MDEARVREIVRQEIESAGVVRVKPMTPEEQEKWNGSIKEMAREFREKLIEFQRDGGFIRFEK